MFGLAYNGASVNKINPKKLPNSKWTAVTPINKEKHFIITDVEFEEGEVVHCLIEAVITKRSQPIQWHTLKNDQHWLMGWRM